MEHHFTNIVYYYGLQAAPRGSRAGYAAIYDSTHGASSTEFSLQYNILKVVSCGCGVTMQPHHNFFDKKAVLSQGTSARWGAPVQKTCT